jgi:hypothetical protein
MTVAAAIKGGAPATTKDGDRIEIIDFSATSGTDRYMLGKTYYGTSNTIIRIGFFCRQSGVALNLYGGQEEPKHHIVIAPVEKEGWFVRMNCIGEDMPRLYGFYADKSMAESNLKLIKMQLGDGSTGTVAKMEWTEDFGWSR